MRRLKRLGLEPDVVACFERRAIVTCKDVLVLPELDLVELVGLGLATVQKVVKAAAAATVSAPTTGAAMLQEAIADHASRFLATRIPPVDAALRGGLCAGTITEVTGPSGCGKTQFCTMMATLTACTFDNSVGGDGAAAAAAAASGGGSAVIYIDTEGAFSAKRLAQMVRAWCTPESNAAADDGCDGSGGGGGFAFAGAAAAGDSAAAVEAAVRTAIERVHIIVVDSSAALVDCLDQLEETIIRMDAKLIVVDSMASLVRKEFDVKSTLERNDLLTSEAAKLKYLAENFKIPVLVSNQVTTDIAASGGNSMRLGIQGGGSGDGGGGGGGGGGNGGGGSYVKAALGNTWAHSVNIRLIIEYTAVTSMRLIHIVKSPLSAPASCEVQIGNNGFSDATVEGAVPPTAPQQDGGMTRIAVRTSFAIDQAMAQRDGQHHAVLQQQHT